MEIHSAPPEDFPAHDIARMRQAIDTPTTPYHHAIRNLYRHTRQVLADTEQWPYGPKVEALRAKLSAPQAADALDAEYADKVISYLAWQDHKTKRERSEKAFGNWAVWRLLAGLGTVGVFMLLYFSGTIESATALLTGVLVLLLIVIVIVYIRQVRI
jgi:hypothetical protein